MSAAARPLEGGRRLSLSWIGAVPFFLYVGVFLLLPTAIIVGGSLLTPGGTLSLANFDGIDKPYMFKAFASSIAISSVSA
ncbi:MAG: acriflavin resistance protein, partial [Chloroflexi bacterium]